MRRKSSNSAEIRLFKLNYEEVMRELRRYAERIVEGGAEAVILIGSLARGDWTAYSDADIIVISNKLPEKPLDRIKQFIDPQLSVDIQPIAYTMEELLQMAKQRRKIVQEIIENGKILAGSCKTLEEIKTAFHSNENKSNPHCA